MTIVTIHDSDSPGAKLSKHAQQIMLDHPTIAQTYAEHLAREQHPDLVRLHHQGLLEEPPATVDPGQMLGDHAQRLLAAGAALDRADAIRQACAALPDVAKAYTAGVPMPGKVAAPVVVAPVRQHSDPGRELLRLVEIEVGAKGGTVDEATKTVLRRDPALARAYHSATPLPMGLPARPATRVDAIVADGLASFARLQQDLAEIARMAGPGHDPLNPGQKRHYSELSPAERERHFPHARRLGPGDRLRADEVRVEKMSPAAAGGGSWAVREAAA